MGETLKTILQDESIYAQEEATLLLVAHVVNLYRRLWQRDPSAHLSKLADILNFQMDLRIAFGRSVDALWSALDLVVLWKEAVRSGLVQDRASLTHAFLAYGKCLATKERFEEACATLYEAVSVWRTQAGPEAVEPQYSLQLADLLMMYTDSLAQVDRHDDALLQMYNAVQILQSDPVKSAEHPDAGFKLVVALEEYANRLTAVGRDNEACDALSEAANICRHEVAKPNSVGPDQLANLLFFHAERLSKTGRHQDAYVAMREMVTIQRTLDQKQEASTPGEPLRYAYLRKYASMCARTGRYSEACVVGLEVVEVWRRVYQHCRWQGCTHLLEAICEYAVHLLRLGRSTEACRVMMDGAEICRTVYNIDPMSETMGLIMMFTQYAGEFAILRIADVERATAAALMTLSSHMGHIEASLKTHDTDVVPAEWEQVVSLSTFYFFVRQLKLELDPGGSMIGKSYHAQGISGVTSGRYERKRDQDFSVNYGIRTVYLCQNHPFSFWSIPIFQLRDLIGIVENG